jgi:hypothetical protein
MPAPGRSRPRGQPSAIDAIVGERDGVPQTVADVIIEQVVQCQYWQDACALAGVDIETANGWLRNAGKIKIRAKGRSIEDLDLTEHEVHCWHFSAAVTKARALACQSMLMQLDALGRGGLLQEVVSVVDEEGEAKKTTTTTRYTLPDKQVLEWRLTRLFPEKFMERIEVTQQVGKVSDADRAEGLVEALSSYLEGVEDGSEMRAGADDVDA